MKRPLSQCVYDMFDMNRKALWHRICGIEREIARLDGRIAEFEEARRRCFTVRQEAIDTYKKRGGECT